MTFKYLLINPILIFFGIWLFVFSLFHLNVSGVINPAPDDFYINTIYVGISALLGYFFGFYIMLNKKIQLKKNINSYLFIKKFIYKSALLLGLVYIIEIAYSGGLPIIYYFTGIGPTYVEFGIPSIHGFFNSLLLFVSSICFWAFLSFGNKSWIRIALLVSIAVPIIGMHRGSLMILVTQWFFIYIAINLPSPNRKLIYIFFSIILVLTLFGTLGDIRSGSISDRAALQPDYEWMPSWLLWCYMYFVSPISNFAEISTQTSPIAYGAVSFSGLTPSFIRSLIWAEPPNVIYEMGEKTFNIASYAFTPFVDWGWLGVNCFTFVLLAFSGYFFHSFVFRKTLFDLIGLIIFLQIVSMTIFSNLFFSMVVIFQIFLLFLLKKIFININVLNK